MVYPIDWFDNNFKSKSHTAELLKAEVENGTLAPQDFDLACTFFPSMQRHYTKIYGFIAGSFIVALSAAPGGPAKVRWPPSRTLLYATVGGGVGGLFGTMQRAQAHLRFSRSLQDPEGFRRAVENTYLREEGERIQLTLPTDRVAPRKPVPVPQQQQQPQDDATAGSLKEGWGMQADAVDSLPEEAAQTAAPQRAIPQPMRRALPENTTASTPSRWDEIRKANTRNANPSSWDSLRQDHERSRSSSNGQSLQDTAKPLPDSRSPATAEDDLAAEKARFEALLDAERNIASQDQKRLDQL